MIGILISIHSQWVEKILNLIKKDEIRKGTAIGKAITRLIKEQGVAPMLIYCTKSGDKLYAYGLDDEKKSYNIGCGTDLLNGKVVARFNATAEHIEYETCSRDISGWWKDDGKMYNHKDACLTYKEMFDYVGAGEGTVIHINDLEIFNRPKELSEFKYYKKFSEIDYMLPIPRKETCKRLVTLTRAPQSYCFVEV